VLAYPRVMKLIPLVPALNFSGEIGRQIRESAELAREYRGYVWSEWFAKNLSEMWTFFAVLLGTGGLPSQASADAPLFRLSMTASRHRLLAVRAPTGSAELLALALIPSPLAPLLSPAIGETYGIGSALIHGTCLFIAGTVFFSLAFLLSTVFSDIWRPL